MTRSINSTPFATVSDRPSPLAILARKTCTLAHQTYSDFGLRGLFAASAARILRKPLEIRVQPEGIAHPVVLRAGTSDTNAYHEVLVMKQYQCHLAAAPKVIVDAGAHVGLASVYFANLYPNAKILAIEPEASNFALLTKNVSAYPNVRAINAAVWSSDGFVLLEDPGNGSWGFRVGRTIGSAVPALSLSTLLANEKVARVDILKMDVEGAEQEIFAEHADWLATTDLLMIELHDWFRPGCGTVVRQALRSRHSWDRGEVTFFQ